MPFIQMHSIFSMLKRILSDLTDVIYQTPNDLDYGQHLGLGSIVRPRLIVSCGVDTNKFLPCSSLVWVEGRFVVTFVGRLLVSEGRVDVVEVCRQLKKKISNMHFIVA